MVGLLADFGKYRKILYMQDPKSLKQRYMEDVMHTSECFMKVKTIFWPPTQFDNLFVKFRGAIYSKIGKIALGLACCKPDSGGHIC